MDILIRMVPLEKAMRVALREAQKGRGNTSPNPAVGAILEVGGKIVATGHHRRAGSPHAEIECLKKFGRRIPKNATLFVTLEPCSTTGRTGPCTEDIIAAGVRRIVIGAHDPNPKHAGRGIQILREAGVKVQDSILAGECTALNEAYNKWICTRLPFVIAKAAMTLDGRLTLPPDGGRWISNAASRRLVQQLREEVDAILVGAETVRRDNPRLTVRGALRSQQPWRVVLSNSGKLPKTAHLFSDRYADRTLVYQNEVLEAVLRHLGQREITSVLIEGGGDVLGQALDGHLLDKVHLFLGPTVAGGPTLAFAGTGAGATAQAVRLERVRYRSIAGDVCVTGYPAADTTSSE